MLDRENKHGRRKQRRAKEERKRKARNDKFMRMLDQMQLQTTPSTWDQEQSPTAMPPVPPLNLASQGAFSDQRNGGVGDFEQLKGVM